MKDKLVRTRHGRFYYRAMSFLRGAGITLTALAVLSAPVVIAYGINAAEAKAAEEPSSVVSETTSTELEIAPYEA